MVALYIVTEKWDTSNVFEIKQKFYLIYEQICIVWYDKGLPSWHSVNPVIGEDM